jgi:hypothetical protein
MRNSTHWDLYGLPGAAAVALQAGCGALLLSEGLLVHDSLLQCAWM